MKILGLLPLGAWLGTVVLMIHYWGYVAGVIVGVVILVVAVAIVAKTHTYE